MVDATNSAKNPNGRSRRIKTSAPRTIFHERGSDDRPDPGVLTADERLLRFGNLLLRAIERRAARSRAD